MKHIYVTEISGGEKANKLVNFSFVRLVKVYSYFDINLVREVNGCLCHHNAVSKYRGPSNAAEAARPNN